MSLPAKIKGSFKSIYDKLVKIDDSPQKVALGFGLGVFCGILPGTGPAASVLLAFVFRVNKLAAFAGGLLTNTWLSIVTFVLAIKVGSVLTGSDWKAVYERCKAVIHNISWQELKSVPFTEIILPLAIGYIVVGIGSGFIGYLIAFLIMKRRQAARLHQQR
jgi:uncharacterized protein (DUF2062 family)